MRIIEFGAKRNFSNDLDLHLRKLWPGEVIFPISEPVAEQALENWIWDDQIGSLVC